VHRRGRAHIHRLRGDGDYAYQMANAMIFFVITLLFAIFQLGVIRRRGGAL
jgi:raffinose/stachyose/melibiose transport system permease protein